MILKDLKILRTYNKDGKVGVMVKNSPAFNELNIEEFPEKTKEILEKTGNLWIFWDKSLLDVKITDSCFSRKMMKGDIATFEVDERLRVENIVKTREEILL